MLVMSPMKVDAFRILMPVLAEMVPALAMPPAKAEIVNDDEDASRAGSGPIADAAGKCRQGRGSAGAQGGRANENASKAGLDHAALLMPPPKLAIVAVGLS